MKVLVCQRCGARISWVPIDHPSRILTAVAAFFAMLEHSGKKRGCHVEHAEVVDLEAPRPEAKA